MQQDQQVPEQVQAGQAQAAQAQAGAAAQAQPEAQSLWNRAKACALTDHWLAVVLILVYLSEVCSVVVRFAIADFDYFEDAVFYVGILQACVNCGALLLGYLTKRTHGRPREFELTQYLYVLIPFFGLLLADLAKSVYKFQQPPNTPSNDTAIIDEVDTYLRGHSVDVQPSNTASSARYLVQACVDLMLYPALLLLWTAYDWEKPEGHRQHVTRKCLRFLALSVHGLYMVVIAAVSAVHNQRSPAYYMLPFNYLQILFEEILLCELGHFILDVAIPEDQDERVSRPPELHISACYYSVWNPSTNRVMVCCKGIRMDYMLILMYVSLLITNPIRYFTSEGSFDYKHSSTVQYAGVFQLCFNVFVAALGFPMVFIRHRYLCTRSRLFVAVPFVLMVGIEVCRFLFTGTNPWYLLPLGIDLCGYVAIGSLWLSVPHPVVGADQLALITVDADRTQLEQLNEGDKHLEARMACVVLHFLALGMIIMLSAQHTGTYSTMEYLIGLLEEILLFEFIHFIFRDALDSQRISVAAVAHVPAQRNGQAKARDEVNRPLLQENGGPGYGAALPNVPAAHQE